MTDREGPTHRAIHNYLRLALPGAVVHHSPNETDMRGPKAMRMVVRAKSLGTLSGFPDLVVFWRGQVLALEVKAPKGYATKAQKAVGAALQDNGVRWAVVRSVGDAMEQVELLREDVARRLAQTGRGDDGKSV